MYIDPRLVAGCASSGTWLFRSNWSRDRLCPSNGFAGNAVAGLGHEGDMDDVLAGLVALPLLVWGVPTPTAATAGSPDAPLTLLTVNDVTLLKSRDRAQRRDQ